MTTTCADRARWSWVLAATAVLAAALPAGGQDVKIAVESDKVSLAGGDVFAVHVTVSQPSDVVVRVYDAAGNFVRSLKGGYLASGQMLMPWNMKDVRGQAVQPGRYTIRVQAGLGLALDRGFAQEGVLASVGCFGAVDVAVDDAGHPYAFDQGNQAIYKFNQDGTPANDYDGKNVINNTQPESGTRWTSLAVGPDDGRLYVSVAHGAQVFDAKSGAPLHYVGGFFGDDIGWENSKGGIGWPEYAIVGGNHRLYLMAASYGRFAAYDRRKSGLEAGVWMVGPGHAQGWYSPGAGSSDLQGNFYFASGRVHQRAQLVKVIDAGDESRPGWHIKSYVNTRKQQPVKLADVYAVANDRQGLLFTTVRNASRLDAFFDCGNEPAYLNSFGILGSDASKLEFTCPSSAAISADGRLLYIGEDGEAISDENSAARLARITRYRIQFDHQAEVQVTVAP